MRYFCISFDENYLARGLALYASLKRHCNEFRLNILCLDERCREYMEQLSLPECSLIPLGDLEAADPELLSTKASKTIIDYSFTLKPCLVRYLMQEVPEGEFLAYLDSDLYFYADTEPLFDELQNGSIGIIAHRFPGEFTHMTMHGIYNAGWVCFRNDARGRACNEWWRQRCLEWCYNRVEKGRYADQTYLDEWPGRFEGTVAIQNIGANVAPWNVGQYEIAAENSAVTVDGQRLIFYHFHALTGITGHLFDSQLSKYGVDLSEPLRQYIYQPYLDELFSIGKKLNTSPENSRNPEETVSPEQGFELIPRIGNPGSPASVEQAKVEAYLYRNLVLAEKDRGARQGVIIGLQNECKRLEKISDDLAYKNALMRPAFPARLKSRLINKLRKKYWMKLGDLRQYEPRKMRVEKFSAPSCRLEDLPSIAIVTPSYMQGHFLERTMLSVLSQEYPGLQYVVQDGGSKDESVEVIKRHASKLAYWQSAPDKGQSDAIRCGFEKCDADIMAWLNSDDMLMPGALRYIGEYFARHPGVDAVYGHRVVVDENDNEIGRWVLPRHRWGILKWVDYVPQETLFWRRSLWEKTGGLDPSFKFALDWDLLLKFEKVGAKVVRLPYFLGCFRTHAAQKTLAEMVDSHGEQEMARIRKSLHGRKILQSELVPFAEGFCLHGIMTSWLLSMGIRI